MIVVRHGGGGDVQAGESVLGFRNYEQGREKFQAETLDFVWLDEEPPHDIYMEAITRTNTTLGPVYMTFTPLMGMSATVKRFLIDKHTGTVVVFMGIYDAEHYTREQADAILASYPDHEREARAYGKPVLGSGAVFPVPESSIIVPPFNIPDSWPRICGLDLGWDHPTAASWLAHNLDADIIYVYDVYAAKQQPVSVHASAIKGRGSWIPVAWPTTPCRRRKTLAHRCATPTWPRACPCCRSARSSRTAPMASRPASKSCSTAWSLAGSRCFRTWNSGFPSTAPTTARMAPS